jgi:hypothetical protein
MASHFSELHTYRVSRRKRLGVRTYLHDHIHQTCLALLSYETCSEDDETPKEEVAIVFTIDHRCPSPERTDTPSLHLGQPVIDIGLLLW